MASDEWKIALKDLLPLARKKLEPKHLKSDLDEVAGGFLTEEETIRVYGVAIDTQIDRVEKLFEILKEKKFCDFLSFCSILDKHNCREMAEALRNGAKCKTESSLGKHCRYNY